MIITNILVIKKLSEYRSLFEEWQRFMKEQYNEPVTKQDDMLMLCHALDDGIARMTDLLQNNRKERSA